MNSFKEYIKNITKYKLLDFKEEQRLGKEIKENDNPKAKEKLTKHNLRLVVNIAQDYNKSNLEIMDIVQEGNIGLMKAVEKFDYTKGYKFSTYATWWINQAISSSIPKHESSIKMPLYMIKKIKKLRRVAFILLKKLGREATDQEIADEMGINIEKVRDIKRNLQSPLSLDKRVSSDNNDAILKDFIKNKNSKNPDAEICNKKLKNTVKDMLNTLSDREREILEMRYGLISGNEKTLKEVSKHFNITGERVRQLQSNALRKMRHPSRVNKIIKAKGDVVI